MLQCYHSNQFWIQESINCSVKRSQPAPVHFFFCSKTIRSQYSDVQGTYQALPSPPALLEKESEVRWSCTSLSTVLCVTITCGFVQVLFVYHCFSLHIFHTPHFSHSSSYTLRTSHIPLNHLKYGKIKFFPGVRQGENIKRCDGQLHPNFQLAFPPRRRVNFHFAPPLSLFSISESLFFTCKPPFHSLLIGTLRYQDGTSKDGYRK